MQQETNTSIIQQTNLEKLVARAKKEQGIEQRKQELESKLKGAKEHLLRRIFSVYFFVRTHIGLPYLPITEEEFEAAEAHLNKLAEEKTNEWLLKRVAGWIRHLATPHSIPDTRSAWKKFLKNGHFPDYGTVWLFGSLFQMPIMHSFLDCNNELKKSAPIGSFGEVPPNIIELFSDLWEKRYANIEKELAQTAAQTPEEAV